MGEEVQDGREGTYGEDEYVARGRPMFGRAWGYQDLLTVERPRGFRAPKPQKEVPPKPDTWPQDTEVDPASWVFWLPEGWFQGIRTQPSSGKTLKCYFNPEGKRFWHKKDIEKCLGKDLGKTEPVGIKEDVDGNKVARVRYVTDSDAIPNWPEEEWLPKDWRMCYRQLPSGLHSVYLPPGQDDGFLYHRHLVLEYLSGASPKLSMFGTSRPMAEIVSDAAKKDPEKPAKKKAKRHRSDNVREATAEDYEECNLLSVASLPMPREVAESVALKRLSDLGVGRPEELFRTAEELQTELLGRGFPPNGTELLAVVRVADGTGSAGSSEGPRLLDTISGMYFRMGALFSDRPCYQSVFLHPDSGRLVGRGIYLFWNAKSKRWQIGGLSPSKAGLAFSRDATASAVDTSRRWMLLKERGEASSGGREGASEKSGGADG